MCVFKRLNPLIFLFFLGRSDNNGGVRPFSSAHSLYVYIYVCMYTYTCIYMYICMYVYMFVYVYVYIYIYVFKCLNPLIFLFFLGCCDDNGRVRPFSSAHDAKHKRHAGERRNGENDG